MQSYRTTATLPNLAIFEGIAKHDPASTAIIHSGSEQSFSYGNLLQDVVAAKKDISKIENGSNLRGECIAFVAENNYNYAGMDLRHSIRTSHNAGAVILLAILAHEAIALPLSHSFPTSELRYLLENSGAKLFLSTPALKKKATEVVEAGLQQKPLLSVVDQDKYRPIGEEAVVLAEGSSGLGGLMLYTSGTTSRPVRSKSLHCKGNSDADYLSERSALKHCRHHSPGQIIDRSMELYTT
jgi:malonyl-CoA/methylmalonyl-CoA synthetase